MQSVFCLDRTRTGPESLFSGTPKTGQKAVQTQLMCCPTAAHEGDQACTDASIADKGALSRVDSRYDDMENLLLCRKLSLDRVEHT